MISPYVIPDVSRKTGSSVGGLLVMIIGGVFFLGSLLLAGIFTAAENELKLADRFEDVTDLMDEFQSVLVKDYEIEFIGSFGFELIVVGCMVLISMGLMWSGEGIRHKKKSAWITMILMVVIVTGGAILVTITVNTINIAPALNGSYSPILTRIDEDTAEPPGDTVANIVVDGSITDADGDAAKSIAVIDVDNAHGTWHYSAIGGTLWRAFSADPPAEDSATLLKSTAKIRFVPKADWNGSAEITFKAWDESSDFNGKTKVDTTTDGGTTAFSTNKVTASITVNPINDAPVLDDDQSPTLTEIDEGDSDPNGDTVASIVRGSLITDADDGAAKSIAVIAVDDNNGTWYFSVSEEISWTAFNDALPDEDSATLLASTAKIRFIPKADWSGSAEITFKAWDEFSGSNGDTEVDTTAGDSTAFSSDSVTASIIVNPINDAPALDDS
ncbi:MAG: hypothetical protein GY869_07065 [Planctomycetes bacterium]|nr:hypothetical protein [Planctomycetota bacterium]